MTPATSEAARPKPRARSRAPEAARHPEAAPEAARHPVSLLADSPDQGDAHPLPDMPVNIPVRLADTSPKTLKNRL